MSNNFQKVRVVKLFASSEYKIRNKAYKTIKFLLKLELGNDKKQLSENDVLAIWKGLYVWLWMQDKPILHEEVVEKISALLPMILSEKLALEFIKGFFITVNREWPNLDAHRLDKYYMLVREMLNSCLRWLQGKEWKYLEEWLGILREIVLVPSNLRALGLKLHFFDIILDELMKIDAESFVVTRIVAEIILSLATTNSQNIYYSKVCKRVVDRLVPLRDSKNLDIDLPQIGEFLLGAATAKREMNGKTRKFFYRLAEKFRLEAKPTCETMETEEIVPTDNQIVAKDSVAMDTVAMDSVAMDTVAMDSVAMDTVAMDSVAMDTVAMDSVAMDTVAMDSVAMDTVGMDTATINTVVIATEAVEEEAAEQKQEETGNLVEIEAVTEEESQQKGEQEVDKSEAAISAEPKVLESAAPSNVCSSQQKSPKKAASENSKKAKPARISNGESDSERRVTFGKRYTKKFTKTTTTIGMSVGTVKQQEIKSILKRKSQ